MTGGYDARLGETGRTFQAEDGYFTLGGLANRPSATESLRLRGWSAEPVVGRFAIYGSDASGLEQLAAEHPEWDAPIHARLADRKVEVIWAARFELARTVEDVLARRTRSLFLDARASIEAAPEVARLLAGELGFGRDWEASQVESFRGLASGYLPG